MKKIFSILIFISSTTFINSQSIEVTITDIGLNSAKLQSLQGEKITALDSIIAKENGIFRFSFENKKYHTGFYRLSFGNNKWIDFIYDNEDVELETDAIHILDSLKVLKSESNKIYYDFIKLNKDYKTKTELLQLMLARYPNEDEYYQVTKGKLVQVQEDYQNFINITAQANPNSFIARYIRSAQLPVIDVEIPFDQQLNYLKTHALDNVNFYDDGLIYSDAFTNKSIEYLTYYRNPQLPMGLLEKEFEAAIDTILSKAKVNGIVYQHIVEYLLDGFKKFGFDNVINYIVENYVIKDEICLNEKLGNTLERRIQQSRNFKIGSIVPNIIIPDSSGSLIDLNKINSEKTLIIFYASWCPHCQKLLPVINEFYKSQTETTLEVFAISIDTSKTDWMNFIKTNNLNWKNVSDLKGWGGKAVLDYYIYATPTMFLIDKNLKMIGMPKTVEELRLQ
jgi:peroxiredoxin